MTMANPRPDDTSTLTLLPVKGHVWIWDHDLRDYILVWDDPFLIKQRRMKRFFETRKVDPKRHRPLLCKICRRLVASAREVAFDEAHGTRVFEAWCSDECFRADPEEREWRSR